MTDQDTLEPGDVDRNGKRYAAEAEFMGVDELSHDLAKQNIVYIKGIAYELSSYSEPHEDGSREATLRLWKQF